MSISTVVDLVETYGVRNIRFQIPMSKLDCVGFFFGIGFKSSSDPMEPTLCVINQDRFAIKDNYKITLDAIDPLFGKEHFYQSDLLSMLKDHREEFKAFYLSVAEDGSDYFTRIEFE